MPRVLMYTTAVCPYCLRAKALLQRKGVAFEEVPIDGDRELMREMIERSKRRTVPQIFIGDYHIGGFDDMAQLDAFGKLDPLLQIGGGDFSGCSGDEDASNDSLT